MQTIILVGLFFCHWVADYTPLSTEYMLKAKQCGKPLLPIVLHALVHAVLMAVFLTIARASNVVALALLQFASHFFIDFSKGLLNRWFPQVQSPKRRLYWFILGLDQYLHALVIIIMTAYAV